MRIQRSLFTIALPLSLGVLFAVTPALGQGKAKDDKDKHPAQAREDKSKGKGEKAGASEKRKPLPAVAQDRGERGNQKASMKDVGRDNRGARGKVVSEAAGTLARSDESRARGRFLRTVATSELRPNTRVFVVSEKHSERFAGRAVALASLRGVSDDDILIVPVGSRTHVKNRKGQVLLDLDEDRARNLGSWKVVTLNDNNVKGAPSFCRSGAGHPVWGRQWCVDKGFGLGAERNAHWARTTDIGNVVLRRGTDSNDLTRDVLASMLGDRVFNRLAAHAITLGLTDQLTGRWIGEANGPVILLISSGSHHVAELVDSDRNELADLLLVALRAW